MKIEGEHVFSANPAIVWAAVNDPEILAKVLPGCEDFHATGENQFAGKLKIKVGPVQGDFQGNVQLSDLDPPNSYRLQLKGKGAPGFVDGEGLVSLAPADAGGTRLHYALDIKIGGRIATVGQRLLDSSSKVITRQALEGLDQQIVARAATAAAKDAADAAARAEAEVAAASATAAAALADAAVPQIAREIAPTDAAPPDAADAIAPSPAPDLEAARRQAEAARQAAADAAEAAARAQTVAAQTKSQEEFAAEIAKGVIRDLVPAPWGTVLVAAGIALVVGLLYFFSRG